MRQDACREEQQESSGIPPCPISTTGSEATKCLAATDQPTVQAEFAFPEVASSEVPAISAPIPETMADPKEPSIPSGVGEPEVASIPLPETGGRSAASQHAPSRQIRTKATGVKAVGCGLTRSSPTGRSAQQRGTRRADGISAAPVANIEASKGTSPRKRDAAHHSQRTAADSSQLGRPTIRRASRSCATVQRLRREKKRVEVYLSFQAYAAARSLAQSRSQSLPGLITSLLAAAAG